MAERRRSGFGGFAWTVLRGINLVRLIILNIVFFGLLALLLVVIGHKPEPLASHSVLVLKPRGRLVEQFHSSPLQRAVDAMSGRATREVRVRDLVAAINHGAHDSRISRIVLLPEDLQAGGFAALREVGKALDRFRASGKKVTVWARSLDQDQYLLATHANRIYLDPMGSVSFRGLSSYRLYYKDLLDKLGVRVHLFRVGKFKSAAEPYILDHASDASKEEDRSWLGSLWTQWLDSVAQARKLSVADLQDDLAHWPEQLQARHGDVAALAQSDHLVDGLMTRYQLVAMLRHQGVPDGHGNRVFRHVDVRDYLAHVRPHPVDGRHADVAIVVAEGDIVAGRQPPGRIGGLSTARLIRQARMDSSVKAMVLRVDSLGGAVQAAEEIRRQVALMRKAGKPVVVSMGDVAASGGYWISMNADRIYAEPDTITGSIGIFGLLYNVPGALDKLGIHSDGVAVGPAVGAYHVTRPLSPEVASTVQSTIDHGYHEFVRRVAKARGKSYDAVDAIAQGRVWTGRQASELGLVDELGGLHAAIGTAAGLAGLHGKYSVGYLQPRVSGFARFVQNLGHSAAVQVALAHGIRLPRWLGTTARRAAPDLTLFEQARPGKPAVYAYCFCTAR